MRFINILKIEDSHNITDHGRDLPLYLSLVGREFSLVVFSPNSLDNIGDRFGYKLFFIRDENHLRGSINHFFDF